MENVLTSVDCVVTEEMARSLTCLYTEEEVRTALFQMHPSKSPGPDGMSPFFFQKFWHVVGHDVTAAVFVGVTLREVLAQNELYTYCANT